MTVYRKLALVFATAGWITAAYNPLRGDTLIERWGSYFKPAEVALEVAPAPSVPEKRRMLGILPPVEFDHPYRKRLLRVERYDSTEEVRLAGCPLSRVFNAHLACAFVNEYFAWGTAADGFGCRVIMANDEILRAHGIDPDHAWRHEIGHCNGWPGDHPRTRYIRY